MPMVGISTASRDLLGEVAGNALEHQAVRARLRDRLGIGQDPGGALFGLALHSKSAHRVHALRSETDVRHHRDAGLNDTLDRRCRIDAAFELDRLRASLGQEAARIAKRLLGAQLPTEEGHVSDDVRAARAAGHRSAVVDHLVDGHRKRGVQPLHDHS